MRLVGVVVIPGDDAGPPREWQLVVHGRKKVPSHTLTVPKKNLLMYLILLLSVNSLIQLTHRRSQREDLLALPTPYL